MSAFNPSETRRQLTELLEKTKTVIAALADLAPMLVETEQVNDTEQVPVSDDDDDHDDRFGYRVSER